MGSKPKAPAEPCNQSAPLEQTCAEIECPRQRDLRLVALEGARELLSGAGAM